MSRNTCKLSSELVEVVPTIASAPILIEALIPGKLTTVSLTEGIKDLDIIRYSFTASTLTSVFREVTRETLANDYFNMSKYVLKAVRLLITHPFIGTNTALGYLLLAIPLEYSIIKCFLQDRVNCRDIGSTDCIARRVSNLLRVSSAREFYEALRIVSPSYLDKFIGSVPDINGDLPNELSLLDVLKVSARIDLNAYELVRGLPTVINYALQLMRHCQTLNIKCLTYLRDLHDELASELPDSEVLRIKGYVFTKILQQAIKAVSKDTVLRSKFSSLLRGKGLNLGSISDVLASSIMAYLLLKYFGC